MENTHTKVWFGISACNFYNLHSNVFYTHLLGRSSSESNPSRMWSPHVHLPDHVQLPRALWSWWLECFCSTTRRILKEYIKEKQTFYYFEKYLSFNWLWHRQVIRRCAMASETCSTGVYLANVGGSPLCGVLPACVTVAPCDITDVAGPCLLTGIWDEGIFMSLCFWTSRSPTTCSTCTRRRYWHTALLDLGDSDWSGLRSHI